MKNEFPRRLLDWFDRLNRWLYAPRSPLNWLTSGGAGSRAACADRSRAGERLWNGSGIGLLVLDEQGRPRKSPPAERRWLGSGGLLHERSRSGCDR